MLALHVIGSGSKGNCAIVENVDVGRGVLVDCGICRRDVFAFAAEAGFSMQALDAILLTHDHSDHVSKMGVVVRGLGRESIALHVLPEVARATPQLRELDGRVRVVPLRIDELFAVAGITVRAIATSHDAAGSCGFLFEAPDGDKLGYVTDTGCPTDGMMRHLGGVRILALEANHDERMLLEGPYPRHVKERVRSDRGHLSNAQAADVLRTLAGDALECVVAMHISEHNNLPSLAREALEGALRDAGARARVVAASQRRLVSVR